MDKRIEKTKEKLRQALGELTCRQPVSEISVSALCEKAGINRTTFYKYYSVPEDIQQEILDETVDDLLSRMWKDPNEWTIQDLILQTLRMVIKNRKLMENCSHDLTIHMAEKLMDSLRFPQLHQDEQLYFVAGGTAAIIDRWLKTDFQKKKTEEVAKDLAGYIEAVIR